MKFDQRVKRFFAHVVLATFIFGLIGTAVYVLVTRAIPLWRDHPSDAIQGSALAVLATALLFVLVRLLIWAVDESTKR